MALPWVLYQVWAFVAPGFTSTRNDWCMPLVVSSTLLFFVGVAFCYFFVFGQAVSGDSEDVRRASVAVTPDIEAYLDFVLTMFIGFWRGV